MDSMRIDNIQICTCTCTLETLRFDAHFSEHSNQFQCEQKKISRKKQKSFEGENKMIARVHQSIDLHNQSSNNNKIIQLYLKIMNIDMFNRATTTTNQIKSTVCSVYSTDKSNNLFIYRVYICNNNMFNTL